MPKKSFDCQDMSPDVRKAFHDWINLGETVGNNVYIEWHTQMWTEEAEAVEDWGMSAICAKIFHTVNDWLLSQGMERNEDVIIKYSY